MDEVRGLGLKGLKDRACFSTSRPKTHRLLDIGVVLGHC